MVLESAKLLVVGIVVLVVVVTSAILVPSTGPGVEPEAASNSVGLLVVEMTRDPFDDDVVVVVVISGGRIVVEVASVSVVVLFSLAINVGTAVAVLGMDAANDVFVGAVVVLVIIRCSATGVVIADEIS